MGNGPVFAPCLCLSASQANRADDEVENYEDYGVPVPGVRDLSMFLPSVSGAREVHYETGNENDDDHSGRVLILEEDCLSICSGSTPTLTTSSSTGEENLSSFSFTTKPPPPQNTRPDKERPASYSSFSAAPPALTSQVLHSGDNLLIATS